MPPESSAGIFSECSASLKSAADQGVVQLPDLKLAPGFNIGASLTGVYARIRDFRMLFSMSPSVAKGLGGIVQLEPAAYGPLFQHVTELVQ